jgi:hypothetical protein
MSRAKAKANFAKLPPKQQANMGPRTNKIVGAKTRTAISSNDMEQIRNRQEAELTEGVRRKR